jgi:hypothetical protein
LKNKKKRINKLKKKDQELDVLGREIKINNKKVLKLEKSTKNINKNLNL